MKIVLTILVVIGLMSSCNADIHSTTTTPNDRALSHDIRLLKCALREPLLHQNLGLAKDATAESIAAAMRTHITITKGIMNCVSEGYKWKQPRVIRAIQMFMTD